MKAASKPADEAIRVLKEAGINELPIPVDQIAVALGADITYEPYDGDVSGMLYRSDTDILIGVNSMHPPTRQRFSLAHEIGHLVMHEGTPVFIDRFDRVNRRDGSSNGEEIQANSFAAELLMPRELVAQEVDRALSKQETITPQKLAERLAKMFKVSPESMSYRLQNLGFVDPAALAG
jgi:Zn-dependent peptidase ImmA (M78 family)